MHVVLLSGWDAAGQLEAVDLGPSRVRPVPHLVERARIQRTRQSRLRRRGQARGKAHGGWDAAGQLEAVDLGPSSRKRGEDEALRLGAEQWTLPSFATFRTDASTQTTTS
jgi:hypothetical protein